MNEVITLGGIIAFVGAFIAIGKVWMDAGITKQTAKEAHANAAEAHKRIDAVVERLGNFMASAGRDFATPADILNAETRLANAIEGMRTEFRNMTGRLDTFLQQRSAN